MASKSWHRNKKGEWVKHRFTDAQRAAYWKKKYLDLLKEMKDWI